MPPLPVLGNRIGHTPALLTSGLAREHSIRTRFSLCDKFAAMHSGVHLSAILQLFIRLGFGLLLSALMAISGQAAERQIMVYAESFAPDSRVVETADGTYVAGFGSDYVRAVAAQAGLSARIEVVPWPRLMHLLQTEPNALAFNMTRTSQREDQFHWIGEIRPVRFTLWGLADRITALPHFLDDAQSLRISAFRNDVVEQYLLGKGFNNLVYLSEDSDTFNMLIRRRIDLIPYSRFAMEEVMTRREDLRGLIAPVFDLEEISTAHYLVMSKSSDPELLAQLKHAFQTLIENGTYQAILGPTLPPY